VYRRRERSHGGERGGLDREIESGCKTHCAQQAQMVFRETAFRVSDGADNAGGKVGAAADEVENIPGHRIEKQSINSEIAAEHVLFRVGLEAYRGGASPVGVVRIAAECGHFGMRPRIASHKDDPKVGANLAGIWKEP
jgi:hypothetical protein